jgi:predicted dienelactone hydrolase
MKNILKYAVLVSLSALSLIGAVEAADLGVTGFTFNAAHRDMPVQVLVWYPASSGGRTEVLGGDTVFYGTTAKRDAKLEAGKHPLIILSHGSGGNAFNLGWISERLVQQGFIVMAPNHPGSTSGDSSPETNIKAWERPQDITALLDAVEASHGWRDHVDLNNITAMGFSIGGYTALAMAGARVSGDEYASYCDTHSQAMDCLWFEHSNSYIKGHVDLHKLDLSKFDGAYGDDRITKVVAIDPGFAPTFTAASLAAAKQPTLVLNLGSAHSIPLGVNGKQASELMPHAKYKTVEGANHFTFLGLCKPWGWIALVFDGDDAVCTEEGDRRRLKMHDEISEKIISFLKPPITN